MTLRELAIKQESLRQDRLRLFESKNNLYRPSPYGLGSKLKISLDFYNEFAVNIPDHNSILVLDDFLEGKDD